jgi:hypothetical protein
MFWFSFCSGWSLPLRAVFRRSLKCSSILKKRDFQHPRIVKRLSMSSLEEPMVFDCLPTTPRRRRRSFNCSSSFERPSSTYNVVSESSEKRMDGRLSWQMTDVCTQSVHKEDDSTRIVERVSNGSCGGLDDGYVIYFQVHLFWFVYCRISKLSCAHGCDVMLMWAFGWW